MVAGRLRCTTHTCQLVPTLPHSQELHPFTAFLAVATTCLYPRFELAKGILFLALDGHFRSLLKLGSTTKFDMLHCDGTYLLAVMGHIYS